MAVERSPSGSSLIDVLDRVLDKGIVIDAWVRVSLVGIDLVTVEARIVVASIETYLKYSEAVGLAVPGSRPFRELTVLENLLAGAFLSRNSRETKARLDHCFALFPRLSERKAQIAGTLSGGEQQMLATARALMFKAKLLAIDEPSLGLAPKIREELFAAIAKIHAEGVPVLLEFITSKEVTISVPK